MDIKEALRNFSERKIVVVGDVMLDRFVYGNVERISPEAPVPVVKVEREVYGLGGAANVAANVKALGGEVSLFGYTGDDSARKTLVKELAERKIKHTLLPEFTQTIEKTRIIGARALQLAFGAPPLIKPKKGISSYLLSREEFDKKIIPISVIRRLPNGQELRIEVQ